MSVKLDDRFWSKVTKTETCWLWIGQLTHNGYARHWVRTRYVRAAKHHWQSVYGAVPAGLMVMHTCDNPLCVRLDHLKLGTPKDNVDDMMQKGRHVAVKGEEHHAAKLTRKKVRHIKRLRSTGRWSLRKLAAKFNVSYSAVRQITSGRSWRIV